jgi:SAM-dependent methyltransferase
LSPSFRDHFSAHAREYARFRPGYPVELFSWLASLVDRQRITWDCATGNGQAARGLSPHFERVVATDASLEQLGQTDAIERVRFVGALAGAPALAESSVDLVTVAQAMHWFDLDPFYRSVRRTLRPDGVLASWTYGLFRSTPEIDRVIERFANETVSSFWPPQRRHVDAGYSDLEFPFEEIAAPIFLMRVRWRFDDLLDYLGTWSAVRRFWQARGFNPVVDLQDELSRAWGDRNEREIRWQLALRVGRA